MNNTPNNSASSDSDHSSDSATSKSVKNQDLPNSQHDEDRMKEETFTINLPDVSDIPGQEHVHVPSLGELSDFTASSDDEEGVGLFGDDGIDEELEPVMGNIADVGPLEKKAMRTASEDMPTDDDKLLREAALDNRDDEGEALNEGSSGTRISGKDLDVPGADADDADEILGEEDEENNPYSLGGDDNDDVPADSF